MIDDDRIRETLLVSGLANPEELTDYEGEAAARGLTFYRAVLAVGRVTETDLVAHLAGALEVPSVSLANFGAKPQLVELVSPAIIKKHRVLPVGLKPRDGEEKLFLAMEDPHDLDALGAVAADCPAYPLVPLLAGPLDLDAAITRVYSSAPPLPALPPRSVPADITGPHAAAGTLDILGVSDLFGDVIDPIDLGQPSDMHSALSLLDDIPRNRHEEITSPTGFDIIAAGESVLGRSRLSPLRPETAFGKPASHDVSMLQTGFSRSNLGVTLERGAGWRSRPIRQVLEALVRVLIKRGLVTEDEINAALDE